MKWPSNTLDSIAVLDRRSIHPSEADVETPYLGLEHINGDGGIHCIETVASAGIKSNKFHFTDRHILFGKLRPYLRKTARPTFSGVCSTDIIPILPEEETSRDYLFHFLRTPAAVELATSRCSGANLPRLSPKQLGSFRIPLPPPTEQKRIAGILDAADALRAKRRESLAQLDTLLQSTFLDMFGDPVTNPMGWPVDALSSVATIDRRSIHPAKADPDTLYLGLEHLDGNGGINCVETVESAGLKSNKFHFTDRHILFGKLRPYLRKTVKPTFSGVCSTDIVPILPEDGIRRDYLLCLLLAPSVVALATSRCSGANLPRLSPRQLASFRIPRPPLRLQRRFAAIVASVERQKARQRAHLAELDTLFAALQSRAFNGEL